MVRTSPKRASETGLRAVAASDSTTMVARPTGSARAGVGALVMPVIGRTRRRRVGAKSGCPCKVRATGRGTRTEEDAPLTSPGTFCRLLPRRSPQVEIRPGEAFPLGATWDGAGTNFCVFSEVADGVELCLFDDVGRESRLALPEVTAHAWHGSTNATARASAFAPCGGGNSETSSQRCSCRKASRC